MKWNVTFYDDRVMKVIYGWPHGIQAKFLRVVALIEDSGPEEVGMPHVKTMGRGLYEVRAQGKEGIGRAFFCINKGRVIVILSGFIKKTQKTPQKEIDLALKRMKEVI